MYNNLTQIQQSFKLAEFYRLIGQRSISLVGLMGVGKTTIGKAMSKICHLPFYDVDREIEECSRLSIRELFTLYGEAEFRALESRVIKRILQEKRLILSCGGGSFINEQNRQLIKQSGITVWLKLDPNQLLSRLLRRDTRPLLLDAKNPQQIITQLAQQRYPLYGRADIAIECYDYEPEPIAYLVLNKIYEYLNAQA